MGHGDPAQDQNPFLSPPPPYYPPSAASSGAPPAYAPGAPTESVNQGNPFTAYHVLQAPPLVGGGASPPTPDPAGSATPPPGPPAGYPGAPPSQYPAGPPPAYPGAPQPQYPAGPPPAYPGAPSSPFPGYPVLDAPPLVGPASGSKPSNAPYQPGSTSTPLPVVIPLGPPPGPEAPPQFRGFRTDILYQYDEHLRIVHTLEGQAVEVWHSQAEKTLETAKKDKSKQQVASTDLQKKQKSRGDKLDQLQHGKHLATNLGKLFLGKKHEDNELQKTQKKIEEGKIELANIAQQLQLLEGQIQQQSHIVSSLAPVVAELKASRDVVKNTKETATIDPKVDPKEGEIKAQLSGLEKRRDEIASVLKSFEGGQKSLIKARDSLVTADKEFSKAINRGQPGQPGYNEAAIRADVYNAFKAMKQAVQSVQEAKAAVPSGPPINLAPVIAYTSPPQGMTEEAAVTAILSAPANMYSAIAVVRAAVTEISAAESWVRSSVEGTIRADLARASHEVEAKRGELEAYRQAALQQALDQYRDWRSHQPFRVPHGDRVPH